VPITINPNPPYLRHSLTSTVKPSQATNAQLYALIQIWDTSFLNWTPVTPQAFSNNLLYRMLLNNSLSHPVKQNAKMETHNSQFGCFILPPSNIFVSDLDSEGHPQRRRRQHAKSRHGCKNCKERKIKVCCFLRLQPSTNHISATRRSHVRIASSAIVHVGRTIHKIATIH
jgi:hypothetical protein